MGGVAARRGTRGEPPAPGRSSREAAALAGDAGTPQKPGSARGHANAWRFPFSRLVTLLEAAQRERQRGPALNTLLEALRPAALLTIQQYVQPPRDEDLAQDLLVYVERSYRRVNPPDQCGPYLAAAVRRLVRRELRGFPLGAVPLSQVAEPIDGFEVALPDLALDRLVEQERRMRVHRAVLALASDELRATAIGAFVMGFTPLELATRLGVSYVAVRQRLARIRELLRADPHLAVIAGEWTGATVRRPRGKQSLEDHVDIDRSRRAAP